MLSKDTKRIVLIAILTASMPTIAIISSYEITCSNEHSETDAEKKYKYLSCKAIFRPFQQQPAQNKIETAGYYQYPNSMDTVSSVLVSLLWKVITDPINIITSVIALFTIGLYWTGRDTARRQLRAYVNALTNAERKWPYLIVTIKNSGQTPAYEMNGLFQVSIVDIGQPANFVDLEPMHPSMGILAPGDTLRVAFDLAGQSDQLTAIRNGEMRLTMKGYIHYRDAFKECRYTEFCMSYDHAIAEGESAWYFEKGNYAT